MKIERLSDEDLLAQVKPHAACVRAVSAALETVLGELGAREPGTRQGWPQRIGGTEPGCGR